MNCQAGGFQNTGINQNVNYSPMYAQTLPKQNTINMPQAIENSKTFVT